MNRQRTSSFNNNYRGRSENPRRDFENRKINYNRSNNETKDDRFRRGELNFEKPRRGGYDQPMFNGRGRGRGASAYSYNSFNRNWGCDNFLLVFLINVYF